MAAGDNPFLGFGGHGDLAFRGGTWGLGVGVGDNPVLGAGTWGEVLGAETWGRTWVGFGGWDMGTWGLGDLAFRAGTLEQPFRFSTWELGL